MGTSGGTPVNVWQEAVAASALAGTPTIATANDTPAWELDTGDAIGGTLVTPRGWIDVIPQFVFYAAAGDAGDLVLRLRVKLLGLFDLVTEPYSYDETRTMGAHPQDMPLPIVFPTLAITPPGASLQWRLDRNDALASPVRILGVNWERI